MPATIAADERTEAAIFARLWESGKAGLPLTVARHVLKLGFSETDKARMHELLQKNCIGKLTTEEKRELDGYINVGDLLAILQSQALQSLDRFSR